VRHVARHFNATINERQFGGAYCNPVYNDTITMFRIVVNNVANTSSFNPNSMIIPPKTGYLENAFAPGVNFSTTPVCTHYNTTQFPPITWEMSPDPQNVTKNCVKVSFETSNFGNQSFIGKLFGINGQFFRHDHSLATLLPNMTYQMQIVFFPHPFHHHINPFQVGEDVVYGFVAQKGEWRDVLSSDCSNNTNGGHVTVRTHTRDFVGKVVMHCHFLPHEDRGLMGFYSISTDPCTSDNGGKLPKQDTDNCGKQSSPLFCLGPIKSAVMLKMAKVVLVLVLVVLGNL